MNIFLINHYAGSPEMGMEFRPYYLAREWVKMGHEVTILAANYSHIRKINPEVKGDMKIEMLDGIRYIWINTPTYEGNGIGRIRNMLAFIRKTLYKVSYFVKTFQPDVVIASSTYPSDNYVARKMAKLSGAKYIYEVHDLWPLSPMELGGMSKHHPFIVAMQHAESFAYRKADAVVSMLPNTREHMEAHGLNLEKWYYIPNGIHLEEWTDSVPLNGNTRRTIEEIKTTYEKTLAYTGTLGLANALDSLVLSASYMDDIAIVMVGKGPEKERLQQLISANKLNNVFMLESIPKREIPALLEMFDFLYIGLQRQALFRFGISPNKLIDYMMAGKPVIQAIDAGNNIVKEARCGIDIEPENPKAIADAVKKLRQLPQDELERMGENGREYVLQHHDYKVLAKRFVEIMEKL